MMIHGHRTRGKACSPTYQSWRGMIARCTNRRHRYFRYYGGRGIKVCERWRKFLSFLADMGERPEGMSLDRIDGEKNYEPGNCKWSTKQEQNANRKFGRNGLKHEEPF